MPEAAYTQRVSSRTPSQTFKHVEYVAPPTAPPPPAQLARPFRHFKLPEAYDGDEVEEDSTDEEEDEGGGCGKKRKRRKKKKKKRKKAPTTAKNGAIKRNGADVYIRTMKVEIIPTRAQFHELMATFRPDVLEVRSSAPFVRGHPMCSLLLCSPPPCTATLQRDRCGGMLQFGAVRAAQQQEQQD